MLRAGRSMQRWQLLHRQARAAYSTNDESTSARSPPKTIRGLDALRGISLNAEAHTQRVSIDAIGSSSFTVSGVRVEGSLLLLPHLATYWNVNRAEEISPHAFTLLKIHNPRPEMLILGTGANVQYIHPDVRAYFRHIGVRFDVYDTKNACHVFNILNDESRLVAAALLPIEANSNST